MIVSVKRYAPELAGDWSKILADSRNGVFIFDRGFIEYHGDRFNDFSAVAYVDGEPVALLPASLDMASGHAVSHPGLTFGGVVLKRGLRGDVAITLIYAFMDAFKEWGATTLTVKLLPQIFSTYPSSEMDYAAWHRGFSLTRRDLSSILVLKNSLPFNTSKTQSVRKARKAGVVVSVASVAKFHALLVDVLNTQHGVPPVHSLNELEFLATRFPEKIFVRAAARDDEIVAGALIFKYGHIWHTQYLAASNAGRALGALDLMIESIIQEARSHGATHLSFGISTVESGKVINQGLIWQKESYGARSITHDFMTGAL